MMRLLVTDKIDEKELAPLAKFFHIDKKIGITPADLANTIGHYEAIITRSSTALPKEILEKGKNLKVIGRAGIGVDNIDFLAATANKVAVLNAPMGNSRVTAEHTIGLLFALLRHIPQASADLKKGIWAKYKYVGKQINGKTLGIVGFGNVGKQVHKIASAIGLKVIVCEPYIRIPKSVAKVTFEELLAQSDIITFHVPATYLTRKMLNSHTLSLCKDGVYVINCSRGAVVDEKAIIAGLETGKIAGFAVDVFTKEPEVDKKLLSYPNVIATPHIAGSTFESQKQSIQEVVAGMVQYIKGIPPKNLLNPQVFKKSSRKLSQDGFAYDAVIFDSDSTLSSIEGIDELGRWAGVGEKIEELTRLGMEGQLPYEKIYEKRLEMVRPTSQMLLKLGKTYIDTLVEDAHDVIEALQSLDIKVYIVSGGYSISLRELGKALGLSDKQIYGNDLLHDEKGNYQTFVKGPLIRNHGKLQIIRQIPGRKIMVGDSITDLETKEYVDLFVGYGGVVRREKVEQSADVFLYHKSLSPVLVIAAGYDKALKLLSTKYRRFIGKALDLLSHEKRVKVHKSLVPRFSEFKKLAYY